MWLSPDAIATWAPAGVGTCGGQWKYSDLAIETALTLRLLFHLPLRQAEGFLQSLFRMMGIELSAPDHTTLSRRGCSRDAVGRPALVHVMVASIGPISSETLLDHGVHVDIEPSHPKMGVLVREAAEHSAGILAAKRRRKATESLKTTLLLSPEEIDQAAKKTVTYRPPGR